MGNSQSSVKQKNEKHSSSSKFARCGCAGGTSVSTTTQYTATRAATGLGGPTPKEDTLVGEGGVAELEFCSWQSEVHGVSDIRDANPEKTVYAVSVTLVQARQLNKVDFFTKGDPYVRVNCEHLKLRSKIRYNTLTPVFNERFDFVVKNQPQSVEFLVYDRDFGTKDCFMGKASVSIRDEDFEESLHPFKWVSIYKKNVKTGEIQVQIVCRQGAKNDRYMQDKVRYVENLGLLTLHLHSLDNIRLNASDLHQLGIKGQDCLQPVCVMIKGTKAFQTSRGMSIKPSRNESLDLNQTCRAWVAQGEEDYILSFSLYHDSVSQRQRRGEATASPRGKKKYRRYSESSMLDRSASEEKAETEDVHPEIGHEEGRGLKLVGRAYIPLSKLLEEPNSTLHLEFRPVKERRLTDAGATKMIQKMTFPESDDDSVTGINQAVEELTRTEEKTTLKLGEDLGLKDDDNTSQPENYDFDQDMNEDQAKDMTEREGSQKTGVSTGNGNTKTGKSDQSFTPEKPRKESKAARLRNTFSMRKRRGSVAAPHEMAPIVATLDVDYSFNTKDEVEKWYFSRLMDEFDFNRDRKLSKAEFSAALSALSSLSGKSWSDEQIELLFDYIDMDNNGELDEDELVAYLRSADFQSRPFGYQMLSYLADGVNASSHRLMDLYSTVHVAGETSSGADILAIRDGGNVTRDKDGLLVYDATSGLIVREHIPGYVKTALDLLYKAVIGSKFVPLSVVRGLLWAMTIKEGKKMDSPKSAQKIPSFVENFNINIEEIEKPLSEYKTFNEFFYRKLKPGAREIACPDDDSVIVAAADCRLTVFSTLHAATSIWIKGDRFTVENLFGDVSELQQYAHRFAGGSLMISRLAPQDYHRWHFPVSGKLKKHHRVDGAFFTVNPIAIRRRLNVFTENERIVVLMESDVFGLVAMVCVGATMVGSINITAEDYSYVRKGDEHGYFSFGGSTVLTLFEQTADVRFRRKFREHSDIGLETLVKMGMRVGHLTGNNEEDDLASTATGQDIVVDTEHYHYVIPSPTSAPADTIVVDVPKEKECEGKSQSNQETDTGEEPQAQGPRWFDYLVVLLGGTATAYFAARLLLLLLDWPEPCKVLYEQVENDDYLTSIFGGVPTRSFFWDGTVSEERVQVDIPLKGPKAKGKLCAFAIKATKEWEPVVLEVHFDHVEPETKKSILEDMKKQRHALETPGDEEEGEGYAYDLLTQCWVDNSYTIRAEKPAGAQKATTEARVVTNEEQPKKD